MQKKNELPFLKALLIKSGRKNSLIPFFPKESAEELKKEDKIHFDFVSLLSSTNWAKDIHYSWFFDILKEAPQELQAAITSILTEAQAKGLTKLLDLKSPLPKVSPFAKAFFMNFLKEKVMEDKTRRELLPFSEMNELLDLNKRELVHLIDFLGIYDLAQDMRQIVDKEILEKIHAALSSDMLQFLQYCSKQPIKWISPKLNLQNWDGSRQQLIQILHTRGLFRLGRAVSGESPHFRWHLFHHLDTGRVKIMESALKQRTDSLQVSNFKKEVLDLVRRYKK